MFNQRLGSRSVNNTNAFNAARRVLGSLAGKRAEIVGGLMLIGIGVAILYEHLSAYPMSARGFIQQYYVSVIPSPHTKWIIFL